MSAGPDRNQQRRSGAALSVAQAAWTPAAAATIIALLVSLPGYVTGFPISGQASNLSGSATTGLQVVGALASLGCALLCLALAMLLYVRRRNDRMALFLSYYFLGYSVLMAGPVEAALFYLRLPSAWGIAAQTVLLTVPTVILMVTFPTGGIVPVWSRWLVVAAVALNIVLFLQPVDDWFSQSSIQAQAVSAGLGLTLLAGVGTQLYRYRRVSGPVERQQVKWVIGGLICWICSMALASGPWLYLQGLPQDASLPWWAPIGNATWWLSLCILPLSLTVAIMRNRLFAIDLIIRRTLIYGLLTGTLVIIYFGTVVLLQAFFVALSGQQSPLSIVISTLIIAALFNPLRRRFQDTIDRRFYRRKYDAANTLATFAQKARDEVELVELSAGLLTAVQETVQPAEIGLWLRDSHSNGQEIVTELQQ